MFESPLKARAAKAILSHDGRPLRDRLAQAARLIGGRVVENKDGDLWLLQGDHVKLAYRRARWALSSREGSW